MTLTTMLKRLSAAGFTPKSFKFLHAAKTQEQILAVLNAEVDARDTAEA